MNIICILCLLFNTLYYYPLASAHSSKTSKGEINWCYSSSKCGPKTWGGICRKGASQSPIDINCGETNLSESTEDQFLTNYNVPTNFYLQNIGHTVKVVLHRDETSKFFLKGPHNATYYLSQLHFHWGSFLHGSEHLINGRRFPLELHMVHINKANDELNLAVLAILFHLSWADNPKLKPIINNLCKVRKPTEKSVFIPCSKINIAELLPKEKSMFSYSGSLTIPPCTENVAWTVFQDTIPISMKQLAAFRRLKDHNGKRIKKNYRPIQPTFTSKRKIVNFINKNR